MTARNHVKVALGIRWSHRKSGARWIRVWCPLFGHEWYARDRRGDTRRVGRRWGAFGYLLPDGEGNFQQCGRCGKRRCSQKRVGDALWWMHERLEQLESEERTSK